MELVKITHKCGTVLGTFAPDGDCGGVEIFCQKCKELIYISNNYLCDFLDDEENEMYENTHKFDECIWSKENK